MPQLVLPDVKYQQSFLEAVKEYQADGSMQHYQTIDVDNISQDFAGYVDRLRKKAQGIGLRPGFEPHTEYWLVEGNEFLGRVDIRHQLNEYLKNKGGHIGYDIRPTQRRKGYGSLALKYGLEKAKELGLEKVLVTCDVDNVASNKVIQKNGGVLEDTRRINEQIVKNRYWIEV